MQPPVRAHTQTTHGTVYTQRTLIGAIAETVFSLYSDDRYFMIVYDIFQIVIMLQEGGAP